MHKHAKALSGSKVPNNYYKNAQHRRRFSRFHPKERGTSPGVRLSPRASSARKRGERARRVMGPAFLLSRVAHGGNIYDPSSLSLNHYVGLPFGYALCAHNPTPFAHRASSAQPASLLLHLGGPRTQPSPSPSLLHPPPAAAALFPRRYVFHRPGSDSSTVTRAVNQTTLTFNAGKLHAK